MSDNEDAAWGLAATCLVAGVGLGLLIGYQRGRRHGVYRPLLGSGRRTHLLVGIYDERNPVRMAELAECLARNADNEFIERVHVFDETGAGLIDPVVPLRALGHPKVSVYAAGRRMRFADYFQFANEALAGERVIVANTDIFFDDSLQRLEGVSLDGTVLALSRWDYVPDGSGRRHLVENAWSQDAWIFDAPTDVRGGDFYLGKFGCDNRIAYEAAASGLRVVNPARAVRTYHLHASGVRNYRAGVPADRVPPPYLPIPVSDW